MHYNKNCFLFVRQVLQLFDRALAAAHFNSQELLTSKLHPVDCVHDASELHSAFIRFVTRCNSL